MKEKVFKFIKRFIAENGYAPSYRDICNADYHNSERNGGSVICEILYKSQKE